MQMRPFLFFLADRASDALAVLKVDSDMAGMGRRAVRGGGKATFDAPLGELPVGAMFEHEGAACLIARRGYLPWSFDGYGAARSMGSTEVVNVLTPRSIVRTFAAGFDPYVHASA